MNILSRQALISILFVFLGLSAWITINGIHTFFGYLIRIDFNSFPIFIFRYLVRDTIAG